VLEFGKVIKYFDNGYGFIKPMEPDSALYEKEVFFHIKAVKKFENDLVEFASGSVKELYFWFTYKEGKKGKEVAEFWSDGTGIPQEYTISILEKYSANLISSNKVAPKSILNSSKSIEPIKSLIRRASKKSTCLVKPTNYSASSLAIRHSLTSINSEELSALLINMSQKNFILSSDLSKYITTNKLGNKYPNIAGIVTMANDVNEWDFDGGFPKDIYRIICQELNLTDKGTSARAIKFTSYQDRKNNADDLF